MPSQVVLSDVAPALVVRVLNKSATRHVESRVKRHWSTRVGPTRTVQQQEAPLPRKAQRVRRA